MRRNRIKEWGKSARGEELQPMSQEMARRLCRAKKRPEYSDPARFFGILPIRGKGTVPT